MRAYYCGRVIHPPMSEKRSPIIPLIIIAEFSLAIVALVWGYLRELQIDPAFNLRSLLIGIGATAFPLAVNFILFGRAADRSTGLKQFAEFRDEIVAPLVTGLNGQHTLLISVLAGIGEELLFRGVLQAEVGIHLAVILFALLHFGPEIRRFYLVFLVYLLFGYFFSALLIVSGGILAPIICHSLYDFLAIRWLERRNQLRPS